MIGLIMQGDTRFVFLVALLVILFSKGSSGETVGHRSLQQSFDCDSAETVEEIFENIIDAGTENQIRTISCGFNNRFNGSFPEVLPSLPNLRNL